VAVPVVVAACWLVLPVTTGEALADALAGRSAPVRFTVGVGSWAGWALGAATIAIARSSSLTLARFVIPAGVVPAVWAVATSGTGSGGAPGLAGLVGLGAAAAAAALVCSAGFGDRSVNGSSYGAERRFALRPPGGVVVVLPVLWAVAVAGVITGPLLLASGVWAGGAVATLVGVPLAVVVVRRTHVLTRRWLVFVPAGVVVHDPLLLTDSLLVQAGNLAGIGPAPAATTATDFTMGATGLAMEIRLRQPAEVLTNARRRAAGGSYTAPGEEVHAVLVAPTRPGVVMRTLSRRPGPAGR
jgi:hypothetical protein